MTEGPDESAEARGAARCQIGQIRVSEFPPTPSTAAAVKTVGANGASWAIGVGRMAVLPARDHESHIEI